ncbi:histidine phosphatase family protein [Thalassotalea atypica]|uniref:histidine phosphatase family protein n=1 Tax=Thalassotalea atypica TaxID=2054316 RepID=UPI0025725482|nr:histidine phosphatase family protein [Thalassotalea atypica]
MAALYLVRHGQASFGQADYDQLSDKGMKQAEILGSFWQQQTPPTTCYTGSLLRHRQTHQHFCQGFEKSQVSSKELEEFNEFDHLEIITRYNPEWANFEVMNTFFSNLAAPKQAFNIEFNSAIERWMSPEYQHDYQENWQQFKQRCVSGLYQVIEQSLATKSKVKEEPKDIMVFTSGGPISVIVQHILQLDDSYSLKLNQMIRNTSVTKILFSKNKLSIDYFNNYSHLEQKGNNWATFR